MQATVIISMFANVNIKNLMFIINYLSCILHNMVGIKSAVLYANIQLLTINIKNPLTNVKSCGIIDSTKGNNVPERKN